MRSEDRPETTEAPLTGISFPEEVLKFERGLIKAALSEVNGSVTHAASLLGISYQRLARIIETRHADLMKERTPVHRRPRKSFIKHTKVRVVSQT